MIPSHSSPSVSSRLALFAVAVLCLLQGTVLAQKIDKGKLEAATRRSGKATKVLTEISALPPGESIPRELLEKAHAVAVIPDVDRVNILIMKAMKGYGLIARRVPGGWSTPAFCGFAVMDRGWTLVKPSEVGIVMLFMDESILEDLQKGRARLEAAAGPVGEMTARSQLKVSGARVLIYALSGGNLRGIEVDDDDSTQSGLNSDNNMNKAIYGLKGHDVLAGKTPVTTEIPPAIGEFQSALAGLFKQ